MKKRRPKRTKHILITGISGSGKTHLSRYFEKRGKNVIDTDDIKSLSSWYDLRGRKIKSRRFIGKKLTKKWVDKHQWLWNRRKLRSLLNENNELYLFGAVSGVSNYFGMFDKVYYLRIKRPLLLKRLQHEGRSNPWGKRKVHRKMILSWLDYSREQAEKHGAVMIDAALTPRQMYNIICGQKKRKR